MKKNTWLILGIISGVLGLLAGTVICIFALLPGTAHNVPVIPTGAPSALKKQSDHWVELSDKRYYLHEDCKIVTGWMPIDGKQYYFDPDGAMRTGWLELDGERYYLKEDGAMAIGQLTIDGIPRFFTASGKSILLVNHTFPIPDDYPYNLVNFGNFQIDQAVVEPLTEMLAAAKAAGHSCSIGYAYRSISFQQSIWDRNVATNMRAGYDYETACKITATTVMTPGHSEHQTGLAIDFNTPISGSFQWLQENCWKYGFILRYPNDKTHKTGIAYEPWHYRYVGKELAKELHESGLCMEEYIEMLTQQQS